jgi:thiol-disulfide isomerase/thioredoxin
VLRRALLLAFAACSGPVPTPEPLAPEPAAAATTDLVGTRAQDFKSLTWLDDQPRTLAALRGQVVLVRFWTDTCPYCRRTAPKLRALDAEFRARGLTVTRPLPPEAARPPRPARRRRRLH